MLSHVRLVAPNGATVHTEVKQPMFVITNIHQSYHENRTHLSKAPETTSQKYYFTTIKNAQIFDSREQALDFWDKNFPNNIQITNPTDNYMLEYINLQPDDPLPSYGIAD